MRVATLNAPGKEKTAPQAYEGMSATTDRTLVVTSSPSLGISPTGLRGEGLSSYPEGLTQVEAVSKTANGGANPSRPAMTYTESEIQEYRKMANGTNMPGASVGCRIHLRPVGTMGSTESPVESGNLDGTTFRAFDKACTRAPGKKPAVSLLPRILRASRRSGAWVSIARLP